MFISYFTRVIQFNRTNSNIKCCKEMKVRIYYPMTGFKMSVVHLRNRSLRKVMYEVCT